MFRRNKYRYPLTDHVKDAIFETREEFTDAKVKWRQLEPRARNFFGAMAFLVPGVLAAGAGVISLISMNGSVKDCADVSFVDDVNPVIRDSNQDFCRDVNKARLKAGLVGLAGGAEVAFVGVIASSNNRRLLAEAAQKPSKTTSPTTPKLPTTPNAPTSPSSPTTPTTPSYPARPSKSGRPPLSL